MVHLVFFKTIELIVFFLLIDGSSFWRFWLMDCAGDVVDVPAILAWNLLAFDHLWNYHRCTCHCGTFRFPRTFLRCFLLFEDSLCWLSLFDVQVRMEKAPEKVVTIMGGVSAWTATLFFMWGPIAQMVSSTTSKVSSTHLLHFLLENRDDFLTFFCIMAVDELVEPIQHQGTLFTNCAARYVWQCYVAAACYFHPGLHVVSICFRKLQIMMFLFDLFKLSVLSVSISDHCCMQTQVRWYTMGLSFGWRW